MKHITLRLLIVASLLAIALWLSLRGRPDGKFHAWFLDVGQGDAILVQSPEGRQVLVDGGPSSSALLDELGRLLPYWDRNLDVVVLTHPDADHMAGLIGVMERYRVGTVVDALPAGGNRDIEAWADVVARAGSRRHRVERGSHFQVGDIVLSVLHPALSATLDAAADTNAASIVLRVDYREASLLLTGDIEEKTEREMLKSGLRLRADVLKVGHHGSNASTCEPFLAAVAPSLAVIQVASGNLFGHPHPETLARLSLLPVARTDLNGRVEIVSDGARLWSKTER